MCKRQRWLEHLESKVGFRFLQRPACILPRLLLTCPWNQTTRSKAQLSLKYEIWGTVGDLAVSLFLLFFLFNYLLYICGFSLCIYFSPYLDQSFKFLFFVLFIFSTFTVYTQHYNNKCYKIVGIDVWYCLLGCFIISVVV